MTSVGPSGQDLGQLVVPFNQWPHVHRGQLPLAHHHTAIDDGEVCVVAGAQVLGRAHEIGQITPGYCADIAMFRTDTLSMAGAAVHDPVGALLLCASDNADYTIVNGRVVVRQGEITTVDMGPLIERHNQLAQALAARTH